MGEGVGCRGVEGGGGGGKEWGVGERKESAGK